MSDKKNHICHKNHHLHDYILYNKYFSASTLHTNAANNTLIFCFILQEKVYCKYKGLHETKTGQEMSTFGHELSYCKFCYARTMPSPLGKGWVGGQKHSNGVT